MSVFPQSYLAVDYESGQFGLALAAVDAQSNQYVPLGCGNTAGDGGSGNSGAPGGSSGGGVPLGAIVGAAVGGFALLVLVIAVCWCLRRRKRKSKGTRAHSFGAHDGPGFAQPGYPDGVYLDARPGSGWPKYAEPQRYNSFHSGASHYAEAPGSPYTHAEVPGSPHSHEVLGSPHSHADSSSVAQWSPGGHPRPSNRGVYEVAG